MEKIVINFKNNNEDQETELFDVVINATGSKHTSDN